MIRAIALAGALLALAAQTSHAAEKVCDVSPSAANYAIITPEADVPIAWRRFSGVWAWGACGGVQCINVVVSSVFPDGTAFVSLMYEPFIPWSGLKDFGGVDSFTAVISGENTFESPYSRGRRIVFTREGKVLRGTIYAAGGKVSSVVTLAKRPEHAFWNVDTAGTCTTSEPPRARTTTTLIEPGTPQDYHRFAGVWKGQWYTGAREPYVCHRLVFTSIKADGSFSATYYWGATRRVRKGSTRVSGRIERHTGHGGEVLSVAFKLPRNNTLFIYYLRKGSDVLEAKAGSGWVVVTREGSAQIGVLPEQNSTEKKKKGRERLERMDR